MSEFETVIGLEVHLQLNTESKIFCACSTEFAKSPNTNICPVCCGYPGVLPVLNQKALQLAIRVCLALNCRINERIYFERKNYFYPDLPKNYQISQYKNPLGEDGFLELPSGKKIKIKRVHLEEDAGKLIHKDDYSLVDFNRTGIPLLEIVSYPAINSPQEAFDYLTYLKLSLQYIGASICDMEKGSLRCDANISLKKVNREELGTKVELKNMNTFRGVKDALDYEIKRQGTCIKEEKKIVQETRLWDAAKQKSFTMRSKEEACDYRYFPEPDLLDFFISRELVEEEKKFIKESPLEKRERFLNDYKLKDKEVDVLISYQELADFFEEARSAFNDSKNISNWLLGPFLEQVNGFVDKFKAVKISPQNFSRIVKYFCQGKINNLAAKKILALSIASDRDIDEIIGTEGFSQISKKEELISFVEEVIENNPKPVKEYLEGKPEAVMFLVGQVMKKTKAKANPKVVRELLERRLER